VNFIKHPSNNVLIGAPAGHDHARLPVGSLPATLAEVEGAKCFVSYWLPEPAELGNLLQGKPVMLMVYSPQHPVVSLGVEP
jgi:hypothetical protein